MNALQNSIVANSSALFPAVIINDQDTFMRHRPGHGHIKAVFALTFVNEVSLLQTNHKPLSRSSCKVVLVDYPSVSLAIYCMDSLICYMAAYCYQDLREEIRRTAIDAYGDEEKVNEALGGAS